MEGELQLSRFLWSTSTGAATLGWQSLLGWSGEHCPAQTRAELLPEGRAHTAPNTTSANKCQRIDVSKSQCSTQTWLEIAQMFTRDFIVMEIATKTTQRCPGATSSPQPQPCASQNTCTSRTCVTQGFSSHTVHPADTQSPFEVKDHQQ